MSSWRARAEESATDTVIRRKGRRARPSKSRPADHAIPLEVGHASAARRDSYFVNAEDHGPAHGTTAIGRAIFHEADHAGGGPPLVGKIKYEPLASALHQGPHGHPVTERCPTYIDAGQPASDRVVLVSPAFLSRRHRASPARWRNWRRNPCAGCLRVAPKGHKSPQVRHFEPNGVQDRTCGASAAVAISGVPCWLVNQQRWSSRARRAEAKAGGRAACLPGRRSGGSLVRSGSSRIFSYRLERCPNMSGSVSLLRRADSVLGLTSGPLEALKRQIAIQSDFQSGTPPPGGPLSYDAPVAMASSNVRSFLAPHNVRSEL